MGRSELLLWKEECRRELRKILDYWTGRCLDRTFGGYVPVSPSGENLARGGLKTAVTNGRVLLALSWAIGAGDGRYLPAAQVQYEYLRDRFTDPQYGWVYNSLDAESVVRDDGKDAYSGTFPLLAFTEYARVTGSRESLELAKDMYRTASHRLFDRVRGGCFDSFTRSFRPLGDGKSLRAHIHMAEACTELYALWPDRELKADVLGLLDCLSRRAFLPERGALKQRFAADFAAADGDDLYGDDAEAAWMLPEYARRLTGSVPEPLRRISGALMEHVLEEGLDPSSGGVFGGVRGGEKRLEKNWWTQCESLNALLAFYEATGQPRFLEAARRLWAFLQSAFMGGRAAWPASVGASGQEERMALCPYHHVRTMIKTEQVLTRLIGEGSR